MRIVFASFMSDSHTHVTFVAPEISLLSPLFPGYEIESLIATGGMGAVYRAVQKSLDRTVAIKILPREFSKDASFCAGFEAEAKAMARLNHPNLIGVYDFGEVDGMLYIIMEYVPGNSLFHAAHGTAIDPAEVIRLVIGICSGLAHAHEYGIIHRDIKPSNILLDLTVQPKIGDFGLARPVERKDQEGEEIFGTPHYTAPEVLNSPQSVGFRADIFSVGVLLHELLTGRLPADDPRPASVISRCDLRFDAIIRRATNPQPDLRYASASEMIKDLRKISSTAGQKVSHKVAPPVPGRTVAARSTSAKPHSSSSGVSPLVWILLLVVAGAAAYVLSTKKTVIVEPVPVPVEKPEQIPVAPEPVAPPESPVSPLQPMPQPIPEPPVTPPQPEPQPQPQPEPEIPAAPKLDVNAFFTRARKIMSERAIPLIAARDKELDKNVGAMKRHMKRMVRKIEPPVLQKSYVTYVDDFIESCEKDKNRIPGVLNARLSLIPDLVGVHVEYYNKERSFDDVLIEEVSKLSPTYILGLQKQIERSKLEKDLPAIQLIEEEIGLVGQDPNYFAKLMIGEDLALLKPDPPTTDDTGNLPDLRPPL
jgi:serine/threonine protein kinase